MRALLVEDDFSAARSTVSALSRAGITTDCAETAEEGLDLARHYDFDVILLDMMLPGISGIDFLRRLRAARIRTPVLALANRASVAAKVGAFAAGADDCVERSCDEAELLARVKAVVRRHCGYTHSILQAGPLALNLDAKEASAGGRRLPLTQREYAVLELLMLRKGAPVSKDTFLNHLYGGAGDEPGIKIVDVFVCKLRRKLKEAGAPGLIRTAWGRGYMIGKDGQAGAGQVAAGLSDMSALLEYAA